jgi:L-alanine-DL-glutamate epimerase-like enolase superfamily enzyme
MTIKSIEVWDFQPPFRDGPYAMSHVVQEVIFGRILRIRTAEGLSGLGEVVFVPSLPEDARKDMVAAERTLLPQIIGGEPADLIASAEELRQRGRAWGGVAFGLETAAFDLLGQEQCQPMSALLGGAQAESVPDYFSISERTTDAIRARMAVAGPERKVIQLKLGIGSLDEDADQIHAALDAMTDGQVLLADANGGWSVDAACEIIARIEDPRLVWEEASNIYEENAEIARRSGKPVMVDQCVGQLAIAKRAVEEAVAASICIKPAFLGGLTVARELRDLCIEKRMRMRIDGPWCGDIAAAAILHLAVGAPADLMIAGCDLREPLTLEPDLQGVVAKGPARIGPPSGAGLGVTLPDGAFGEPDAVYR